MGSKFSIYVDEQYVWKEDQNKIIHRYFLARHRPGIGVQYTQQFVTDLVRLIDNCIDISTLLQESKVNFSIKNNNLKQELKDLLLMHKNNKEQLQLLKSVYSILCSTSDNTYHTDNCKSVVSWLHTQQNIQL